MSCPAVWSGESEDWPAVRLDEREALTATPVRTRHPRPLLEGPGTHPGWPVHLPPNGVRFAAHEGRVPALSRSLPPRPGPPGTSRTAQPVTLDATCGCRPPTASHPGEFDSLLPVARHAGPTGHAITLCDGLPGGLHAGGRPALVHSAPTRPIGPAHKSASLPMRPTHPFVKPN